MPPTDLTMLEGFGLLSYIENDQGDVIVLSLAHMETRERKLLQCTPEVGKAALEYYRIGKPDQSIFCLLPLSDVNHDTA